MLRLPVNRAATWAMLALLVVGGVLLLVPVLGQTVLPALSTMPEIGVALTGLAFAGLCVFVRCRGCGYRLFWHAVSRRDHSDGIWWFLTAEECPKCRCTRHPGPPNKPLERTGSAGRSAPIR
jgi:predicted nucleic-acid-binding Zn-ribbon protein